MAAITTTGTLTAGNSRTFALAPGSALTLTLLPNCRVTVTETPETVSASDAGGNSPRTHNHQLAGVFTYGPYAMGGSVVVDNASNSGSTVTWGRKDTAVTTDSAGTSLVSGDNIIPLGGLLPTESVMASRSVTEADDGRVLELGPGVTVTLSAGAVVGLTLLGPTTGSAYVDVAAGASINGLTSAVEIPAMQAYRVWMRESAAGAYILSGGSGYSSVITPPPPPPPTGQVVTVNGITSGALGASGTPFEGLQLTWGDDFDVMPEWYSGSDTSGAWSSSRSQNGNRRIQGNLPDRAFYVDPKFRGDRNQSPVNLNYSAVSQAASVLTITAQPVPTALIPYLPTNFTQGGGDANGRPTFISGALRSWPSFYLSAASDFALAVKARFPSGAAAGWWPSFWTTSFRWPDDAEIDLIEAIKSAGTTRNQFNLHGSLVDGGGNVMVALADYVIPNDRWVTFLVRKQGTTLLHYDDAAVEGTLALRFSYTDARVSRIRGAHDIRMELAVNTSWDSSTFNAAHWPKSYEIDWFQVWCPAGTPLNNPTVVLGYTNTTPGGSWAYTIPADSVMFGGAVSEVTVSGAFDNMDAPGASTAGGYTFGSVAYAPGGMSIDLGARTVTGTVPTTEGGRMGLLFLGSLNTGGAAKRAIRYFNVAPAAQATLLPNLNLEPLTPTSLAVSYTDFHSGNLGPHTYAVSTNATWLTVTPAPDQRSATLVGTSPGSDENFTITVTCTNVIGQSTTVVKSGSVLGLSLVLDRFNEATGVALSAHTPDIGGAWTKHPLVAGTMSVDATLDQATGDSTTSALYLNAATMPGSANYYVEADARRPVADTTFRALGVSARFDAAVATGYTLQYDDNASALVLSRVVTGTTTVLATHATTLPANTARKMRLSCVGSMIVAHWNSALVMAAYDTAVSGAGVIGIRSRATGFLDNVVARATGSVLGSDTFTAGSDATLAGRTATVGGVWVRHSLSAATMTVRSASGAVEPDSASSAFYLVPAFTSANYIVSATIRRYAADATTRLLGVVARASATTADRYDCYYVDSAGWVELVRLNAGVSTVLGTYAVSFPANTDVQIGLACIGTTIQVIWNGLVVLTVSDATLPGPGAAGIRGRTGGRIDNFTVVAI